MSKTAGMTGQQYGDWFEGECQKMLDQLMQKGPTFFSRLYDTGQLGHSCPSRPRTSSGCTTARASCWKPRARWCMTP